MASRNQLCPHERRGEERRGEERKVKWGADAPVAARSFTVSLERAFTHLDDTRLHARVVSRAESIEPSGGCEMAKKR